jgi:hypothetical protein
VCLVLYLVPQTSVIGAILLTGYLGGAVASQVRAGNPMFTHALFPVYVALILWGGLRPVSARAPAGRPAAASQVRSAPPAETRLQVLFEAACCFLPRELHRDFDGCMGDSA